MTIRLLCHSALLLCLHHVVQRPYSAAGAYFFACPRPAAAARRYAVLFRSKGHEGHPPRGCRRAGPLVDHGVLHASGRSRDLASGHAPRALAVCHLRFVPGFLSSKARIGLHWLSESVSTTAEWSRSTAADWARQYRSATIPSNTR